MKQVILLLAIHLLIFHQYQKDKKESSGNQDKLAIKDKIQNKKQPLSLYESRQKKDSSNSSLLKTSSYEFQSYTFLRMR
ncbi:hypothetical protein [Terrimonas pollutisoli]|uniref:hypothetical protein n=1 Tax=Terrimonas pollutisoli TaxID=3034147 RepID=UPI0023EC4638|nr:hypothetical protein [Terrimonas sp. H1YJ31]